VLRSAAHAAITRKAPMDSKGLRMECLSRAREREHFKELRRQDRREEFCRHRSTLTAQRLPARSNWFESQLATKKAGAPPAAGLPAYASGPSPHHSTCQCPTDSSDEADFASLPHGNESIRQIERIQNQLRLD
jgi:hypothetical protein